MPFQMTAKKWVTCAAVGETFRPGRGLKQGYATPIKTRNKKVGETFSSTLSIMLHSRVCPLNGLKERWGFYPSPVFPTTLKNEPPATGAI